MRIVGNEKEKTLNDFQKRLIKILAFLLLCIIVLVSFYFAFKDDFVDFEPTSKDSSIYKVGGISEGDEKALSENNVDIYNSVIKKNKMVIDKRDKTSKDNNITSKDIELAYFSEVKNKVEVINKSIKKNSINDGSFDHTLFREIINYSASGIPSGSMNSFEDVTPNQWVWTVRSMLFNQPESDFNWHLNSEETEIYHKLLAQKIYKEDIGQLSKSILIEYNKSYGVYNSEVKFIFTNKEGKKYTAYMGVRDHKPLLLDIEKY